MEERRTARSASGWHGKAFLIEALVLLAFIVASLAVLMSLFVSARVESVQGERLAQAVQLARNAAEEFSADPLGSQGLQLASDGLTATVEVSEEPHENGVLARAVVTVLDEQPVRAADEGAPAYTLSTARYVPDAEPETSADADENGETGALAEAEASDDETEALAGADEESETGAPTGAETSDGTAPASDESGVR